MRGKILGNRYRIINRIGEGGMAYVYLAKDEKLGRKVAIKVLHEHMETNADIRKRFQMEAQAVSALDHPNIVKIYDFSGDRSDRLWIVTEVINGENLAQFVSRFHGGWLHPALATCIVREICKALDKAHNTGIVHRDIKPENIMITKQGIVKLMDFGIAKDLGRSSMTVTGTFMGSPSYMSPEQIRGKGVDHRSDIYSLAVLYYEIVTGRLPFSGQTTHDVVMKIMEGHYTYPRFLVPTIPDRLDKIIVKGMTKDKDGRFHSIVDMGRAIDQLLFSFGFVEAHVELERYFKDPAAYERRLAKLDRGGFNKKTVQRTKAQTRRAQSSRYEKAKTKHPTKQEPPPRTKAPTEYPHRKTTADSPQLRLKQAAKERTRTGIPLPDRNAPKTRRDTSVVRSRYTRYEQGGDSSRKPRSLPPRRIPQPRRAKSKTRHTALERPLPQPPAQDIRQVRDPQPPGRQKLPAPPKGRAPRARPRGAPRRAVAKPQGRRSVQVVPEAPMTSRLLGFLLVGAVGLIAIWGFWELNRKLQETDYNSVAEQTEKTAPRYTGDKDKVRDPKTRKSNKRVNRRLVANDQRLPTPKPIRRINDSDRRSSERVTWQRRPTPRPRPKTVTKRNFPAATPAPKTGRNQRTTEPPKTVAQVHDPRPTTTPEPVRTPEPEQVEEVVSNPDPTATPKPAKKGPARLFVNANPPAEIYLDGRFVGTTNATAQGSGWIKVTPGRHHWELRRRGYRTVKQFKTFPRGEDVNLGTVQLQTAERKFFITLEKSDRNPVQVELQNLESKESHLLTVKKRGRKQLTQGRYQMRVKQGSEVVMERIFQLSGNISIALPARADSGGDEE